MRSGPQVRSLLYFGGEGEIARGGRRSSSASLRTAAASLRRPTRRSAGLSNSRASIGGEGEIDSGHPGPRPTGAPRASKIAPCDFVELTSFDLAERVGFEPTVPVKERRFSRPVHSTALPPLRHVDAALPARRKILPDTAATRFVAQRRSAGRLRKAPEIAILAPGALIRRALPLDKGFPGGFGTRCSGMVKCDRRLIYH
jgi:hypothetical protein